MRASLAVDPAATGRGASDGKFKIDGRAGAFRIAVQGDAGAPAMPSRSTISRRSARRKVNVSGRLDADDGAALVELVGLDRVHRGRQAAGTARR